MQVEDQSETIAFLSDPASYACGGAVEVIETHISAVFLIGDRAFKLKWAVHLPYADFATPEIRLAACEKELRLNRATTPELYLKVRTITRDPEGLVFDGDGPLVDAVVEMQRFDAGALLDQVAQRGELTAEMITTLAKEIVSAHRQAEVSLENGRDNIAAVLDINRAGFEEGHVFSDAEVVRIDRAFRLALAGHAERLNARAARGCVRRCHGDLHLRNLCLYDGRPRLFDCIDFNDRLATSDILYDLAFLAMDLWHRGFADFANIVVNLYFDQTDNEDGYACMPFFLALRAAVRAHVTATQCEGNDDTGLRDEARSYYDLALALLEPYSARLLAIGGFSGSGKSTIAAALAPHIGAPPGARLIESDRVRKAMFGVDAKTRLPETAYASNVSERVYANMVQRSERLLCSGASVVANAVYDRADGRAAIEGAASAAGVPFHGFWLDVDTSVLQARVATRTKGPSDANVEVLQKQLAHDTGVISWGRIVNSGTVDDAVDQIRRALIQPMNSDS